MDGARTYRQGARNAVGFTWPPTQTTPTEISENDRTAAAATAAQLRKKPWGDLRACALDLESTLVPILASPLAVRISRGDVVLDAPNEYCDRCGADIGPNETREFGCAACADARLPWTRFVRLGVYGGGLAQAVRDVKFHRFRTLGVALGRELGKALLAAGLQDENTLLTPVPTTTRRRLKLGLDHTLTISRGVSREFNIPIVRALRRIPGPAQLDVSASARRSNVRNVFRATRAVRNCAGATVVLVDDVRTTGSTLRAAAQSLQRLGDARPANIWAAVVAVAPSPTQEP